MQASCYTSIKTRIETETCGTRDRNRWWPLATLPSKQGLKPKSGARLPRLHRIPLATLPSKQGLKLRPARDNRVKDLPLATLPSKQGLKLRCAVWRWPSRIISSCYTSIKTRIETPAPTFSLSSVTTDLLLHFHQNKD